MQANAAIEAFAGFSYVVMTKQRGYDCMVSDLQVIIYFAS